MEARNVISVEASSAINFSGAEQSVRADPMLLLCQNGSLAGFGQVAAGCLSWSESRAGSAVVMAGGGLVFPSCFVVLVMAILLFVSCRAA